MTTSKPIAWGVDLIDFNLAVDDPDSYLDLQIRTVYPTEQAALIVAKATLFDWMAEETDSEDTEIQMYNRQVSKDVYGAEWERDDEDLVWSSGQILCRVYPIRMAK